MALTGEEESSYEEADPKGVVSPLEWWGVARRTEIAVTHKGLCDRVVVLGLCDDASKQTKQSKARNPDPVRHPRSRPFAMAPLPWRGVSKASWAFSTTETDKAWLIERPRLDPGKPPSLFPWLLPIRVDARSEKAATPQQIKLLLFYSNRARGISSQLHLSLLHLFYFIYKSKLKNEYAQRCD